MNRIAVLFLALWAPLALGADATVTWTNPTTNTDGSSIPPTGPGSITGSRVEYGTCVGAAFGTKAGEVNSTGSSATVTNIGPGTVCFRVFSRNTYGNESAASNVAVKVIPTPVPNPPVLSSTITLAYDLRNGRPYRVVGTIDLGTPCGKFAARSGGQNYYTVDRSEVELTRRPRSARLVTVCAIS